MTTKGQSLSFLERFQGKKSTISKEGLLHLFGQHQTKISKIPLAPHPLSLSPKEKDKPKQITPKHHLQSFAKEIIRSQKDLHEQNNSHPSSRLSYRTQVLRKGQDSRDFNLPKIKSKFNNSQHSLYSYQGGRQVQTDRTPRITDPQSARKPGYMLNKNMDVNALEHLQYLTKLQQKLVTHKNQRR